MLERLGGFFLDIIEVVVFAIAIFLFVYLLVLQPHKIKGSSMEPNYHTGEYLLTDKVTYRFNEPQRGDVIVFEAPESDGDEFIKRIIGLPGDEISIKDAKVYLNGTQLSENYLPSDWPTPGGSFLPDGNTVRVPDGAFFVLGDNRTASSDSRAWGFVPRGNITVKAWVIYWPPQESKVIEHVNY